MRRIAILVTLFAGILSAQTVAECQTQAHHGQRAAAQACYQRLARAPQPGLRGEGLWGLHQYQDASKAFEAAVKQSPQDAHLRVRWGRLFLERFNPGEAVKLFQEALQIKPNDADALLGLALVSSESFEGKAAQFAEEALKDNPKLTEARELLAKLALEDNNPEKARKEVAAALALSPEALQAMAVGAAADLLEEKPATTWLERIQKVNPVYGEGYETIGHFYVLNRRYEEGIQAYRKAVALDPELWSAHSQLGINLMRLGRDGEARRELKLAHDNGFRDAATTNSLTLMDSYKRFVTSETPRTIIKLDKKEAELLRPYVQAELDRAMSVYDKKYGIRLPAPVQVEVYPNHEDFAVRTMGLPGLGALGVTFGTVVAMDSPSGRKPGSFHWASTLWHELSHVYVLTATQHKVPRWFTEGLAVHEETAASPEWGDRLDPEVINAIQNKKLLPIAELDRGFVHPTYPNQVIVSYFQAGRICDYINETRGFPTLMKMMRAFAESKPTRDVVQQQLGVSPEEFDKQFLAWLDKQTGAQVTRFKEWREQIRKLNVSAKAKQWDEVIRSGKSVRDLFPDYVETGSAYELLADAYDAKGEKQAAAAELLRYAQAGGRRPETLKRLALMQEQAGQKKEAAYTLERINWIYPKDLELHRRLGGIYMDLGQPKPAVREFTAALACQPTDPAAAHYDLARAFRAARQSGQAKEHVLLALEAAPGFRPAQKLLLELSSEEGVRQPN